MPRARAMAQTAAGALNSEVPSSRTEAAWTFNMLPCRSGPPSARDAVLRPLCLYVALAGLANIIMICRLGWCTEQSLVGTDTACTCAEFEASGC